MQFKRTAFPQFCLTSQARLYSVPGHCRAILLAITWALLGLWATDSIAQTTVEYRVPSGDSDVEEGYDEEEVSTTGFHLDMGKEEWIGVRFSNVTIPDNATITNAYIQFRAYDSQSNDADYRIYGYDTDNAGEFQHDEDEEVSGKSRTSASIEWPNVEAWTIGNDYQTPDIKSAVQEIVDRSGWISGNGLAIIIRSLNSSGDRNAVSYNNDPANAPLLHIEYTTPPPTIYYVRTDGNNSNTGLGTSTSEAWATVAAAAQKSEINPGDTVYVMPGTYAGNGVVPNIDGESGSTIKFIADRDGAIFGTAGEVYLTTSGSNGLLITDDDYLEFDGFHISGGSDTVYWNSSTGGVLRNCFIYDGSDNGIEIVNSSTLEIINCLIYYNLGDGVSVFDGTVQIVNCTIAENDGDGIEQNGGTMDISNSIFFQNASGGLDLNAGTMNHTYNCVSSNGSNFEGTSLSTGEITTNPLFTDIQQLDFTLTSGSPAIDVGTDATGIVDGDILGNHRPIGSGWDMGCYEYTLLGDWQLETGSGSTATDSSGNGNDGTLQSSTAWEAARCGQSITLNGSSDWVDLGQIDIGTQGYTVSAWFKSRSNAQQTIFAATGTSSTDHLMFLELSSTGTVQFVHRSPIASSGGTTLASSETFDDGYWHHVAAVKSTTDLRLYIDGELIDTMSDTTDVHSSVDVVLGRYGVGLSERYFSGSLDDVRLYGAAMSDSEIAQLFGLMGRWRLDETTGTTAIDSSVFGNSGTLNGGFTFDTNSYENARVGAGLIFDGTDDHIRIPNSSELQITDSLTISAWIKGGSWGSSDNANAILRKGEGNPNNYQIAIIDGQAALSLDDTDFYGYRGDTVLDTDTWYHVTGTWDGTSAIVYVNGVMDHASAHAHSAPIGTDTRDLYLGGRSGTDLFDGIIDDVRLYNRALCADEILELYSSGNFGLRITKWLEVR
ncbi:MAG: hypothetical protein COA78_13340 [Blastopirellula sp.]|nr:MAG: hypothetical protein COA78_13340 [Blastopirellula sp.]